jgi:hypothetical protein
MLSLPSFSGECSYALSPSSTKKEETSPRPFLGKGKVKERRTPYLVESSIFQLLPVWHYPFPFPFPFFPIEKTIPLLLSPALISSSCSLTQFLVCIYLLILCFLLFFNLFSTLHKGTNKQHPAQIKKDASAIYITG